MEGAWVLCVPGHCSQHWEELLELQGCTADGVLATCIFNWIFPRWVDIYPSMADFLQQGVVLLSEDSKAENLGWKQGLVYCECKRETRPG